MPSLSESSLACLRVMSVSGERPIVVTVLYRLDRIGGKHTSSGNPQKKVGYFIDRVGSAMGK